MEDRYLYKAKTTPKEKGEFNNVWVTGNLIVSNGKYYIHPVGNVVNVKNETGRIIVMHEVIPDTICRCTGLKDKNGNLIWENDILNPFSDLKGIVKFGERSFGYEFGFYIEWISKACYRKDFLYWVKQENLGIIGNIFDNPDKCN